MTTDVFARGLLAVLAASFLTETFGAYAQTEPSTSLSVGTEIYLKADLNIAANQTDIVFFKQQLSGRDYPMDFVAQVASAPSARIIPKSTKLSLVRVRDFPQQFEFKDYNTGRCLEGGPPTSDGNPTCGRYEIVKTVTAWWPAMTGLEVTTPGNFKFWIACRSGIAKQIGSGTSEPIDPLHPQFGMRRGPLSPKDFYSEPCTRQDLDRGLDITPVPPTIIN